MTDLHEIYNTVPTGTMPLWNNPEVVRRPIVYIHPSASVHQTTSVWHGARILADVAIGHNCSIGGGTEIGRGSKVGNYTRIGANCFFPPNSVIGNSVFIGPGVNCADDRHPYVRMQGDDPPYTPEPPVIEDGAVIGLGAVLLPGVRIGKNAFVAAGSVVTRDVPDNVTVKGPAAKPYVLSEIAAQALRGKGAAA